MLEAQTPTDQIYFGLTKTQRSPTAFIFQTLRLHCPAHADPASAHTRAKLIPTGIWEEQDLQNPDPLYRNSKQNL